MSSDATVWKPGHYGRQRDERLRAQAAEAFARHALRESEPRRWLLQRPHRDGGWESAFTTEVFVGWGGKVIVHGDIEHVIFAHYGDRGEPRAALAWIGECTDLDYYVAQKARIGSGREIVEEHDDEAMRWHISDLRAELERDGEMTHRLQDALGDARDEIGIRHPHAIIDDLIHAGIDAERVYYFGQVIAPRVYYAHAAVARLCALMRADAQPAAAGGSNG